MVFQRFTKKPFKERVKDTGFLLKNSFSIIGKDKDIIKPTIRMAVLSVIITTLVFIAIWNIFVLNVGTGILILLFTLIFFFPFKIFYDVRQKANQSWIVYNTVTGHDIGEKEARAHTKEVRWTLRGIAFIELMVRWAAGQRGKKKGMAGILFNIFLAALIEIWDLLSHYLIPAVVVEQKPVKELLPQIKSLKNNVPATLVGVFGIDFVGNVVHSMFAGIYFVMLVLSVLLGWALAGVMPGTVFTIAGFSFSWVPVLIALYVSFIIGGVLQKFVESIKVIYFTIFYVAIRAPKKIDPSMRKELTHYLRLGK